MKDIFLCHASEDKADVVRPIYQAMINADISCWLDEAEIHWGDSITQKVNDGLGKSRYVIVVLSLTFLSKNWPQRELNTVLNQEASTGEVRVLPLLVGNLAQRETIMNQLSLMSDKRYLQWDGSTSPIIEALQKRLGKALTMQATGHLKPAADLAQSSFPVPKIKKRFTQRDKDLFLKKVFQVLKSYFQKALKQLETSYPEIETDFTEIHNFKFVSKIYVNGSIKTQWKIWIGGISGQNEIAYSIGNTDYSNDNSCNGMLSIQDDGYEVYVRFSFGGFNTQGLENKNLTPEEAAKFLWIDLTKCLEYLPQ